MSSTGSPSLRAGYSRWDVVFPDASYQPRSREEPSRLQEELEDNYRKEVPRRNGRSPNFPENRVHGRSGHDLPYGNFQMQPRNERQRTFPKRKRPALRAPRPRNLVYIEPMPEAEFAQHVRMANRPQRPRNDIVSVYQRSVASGEVTEDDRTKLTMEILKTAPRSVLARILSQLSRWVGSM